MGEMQAPNPAVPLDDKERFVRLFDSYVHNFNAYTTNVLATSGYLLLAIGWIVGSEQTRSFFTNTGSVRTIAGVAVVLILIIHASVSVGFYRRSQQKHALIARYTNLDPLPVEDYAISIWLLIINIMLNTVLSVVLLVVLFASSIPP